MKLTGILTNFVLSNQQYQQNNHGIYVDLNLYCYSEAEIFVIAHTLGYAT